jgi:hypothetical protein
MLTFGILPNVVSRVRWSKVFLAWARRGPGKPLSPRMADTEKRSRVQGLMQGLRAAKKLGKGAVGAVNNVAVPTFSALSSYGEGVPNVRKESFPGRQGHPQPLIPTVASMSCRGIQAYDHPVLMCCERLGRF